ncbi:hypothetical protein [Methylocapsa aurea]|uniref:hypothetical protein n=1 Tax=Methylocapsa aurea TaxID=663610 RepID=UPI0012EB29B9|nr:hypothetical protein [Methylocapsa aurea]
MVRPHLSLAGAARRCAAQHLAESLGPSLAASAAPAPSLAPRQASAAALRHKIQNHGGALDQARGAKTEAARLPSDYKTYRTKLKMLADAIQVQADERGHIASANAAAFFVCRYWPPLRIPRSEHAHNGTAGVEMRVLDRQKN